MFQHWEFFYHTRVQSWIGRLKARLEGGWGGPPTTPPLSEAGGCLGHPPTRPRPRSLRQIFQFFILPIYIESMFRNPGFVFVIFLLLFCPFCIRFFIMQLNIIFCKKKCFRKKQNSQQRYFLETFFPVCYERKTQFESFQIFLYAVYSESFCWITRSNCVCFPQHNSFSFGSNLSLLLYLEVWWMVFFIFCALCLCMRAKNVRYVLHFEQKYSRIMWLFGRF